MIDHPFGLADAVRRALASSVAHSAVDLAFEGSLDQELAENREESDHRAAIKIVAAMNVPQALDDREDTREVTRRHPGASVLAPEAERTRLRRFFQ